MRAEPPDRLDGHRAFDLYATYGLPFEISRDIAREQGLDVDEAGFKPRAKSTAWLPAAAKPWASWAAKMRNSLPAF
jgi:alanyl-tRNA synthetase